MSAAATRPGPASNPGFPTFAHLPADQGAHPEAANDWWYTIGHLWSGGHRYGYEVQLTRDGYAQLAIVDVTSGKYYSKQLVYKPEQVSASTKELDVRMPDASLSGPMNDMRLKATLPDGVGSLDLTLNAQGPAIYNNGTGLLPFLGGTSYYYSLPNVKTSGTLTLGGKTTQVTGKSWLDRQWGNWDWKALHKWTWMALQLDNGETINLWDLLQRDGDKRWATVLNPNGAHTVVTIDPLAAGATNFQTSPTTGQRYAGKWTVTIPSLRAKLTVTAKPVLQEIQYGQPESPGINEASADVTGTYQGKPIKGLAYVEQFGRWT